MPKIRTNHEKGLTAYPFSNKYTCGSLIGFVDSLGARRKAVVTAVHKDLDGKGPGWEGYIYEDPSNEISGHDNKIIRVFRY